MGDEEEKITPQFLEKFNAENAAIEAVINSVKAATGRLDNLAREAQTAFSPDDQARISKTLQEIVAKASSDAKKGKTLLDDMKKRGETLTSKHPKSERVQPCKTQYMRLCKLYVEVMKEHQRAKESLRKSQTDNLVRRGELVYGDTKTKEEIRAAVESNPGGFLQEAILTEASEEAQQAYIDAQSRARDVTMLVRSLNEVAGMFNDLATLVNQQSEMLDSIESNVESAQTYIKKGNENLKQAIELQKKTRKCYCCLLCIVIVIVIVLIAGLGSFFGGAFKSS